MKYLKPVCIALVLLTLSVSSYAQGADERVIIKYDPLFWKDQLKLTADQYYKIKEINYEYYQKLMDVVKQKTTGHITMKVKAEEFLEERSNLIWNTFHTRQKRKWIKMVSEQS